MLPQTYDAFAYWGCFTASVVGASAAAQKVQGRSQALKELVGLTTKAFLLQTTNPSRTPCLSKAMRLVWSALPFDWETVERLSESIWTRPSEGLVAMKFFVSLLPKCWLTKKNGNINIPSDFRKQRFLSTFPSTLRTSQNRNKHLPILAKKTNINKPLHYYVSPQQRQQQQQQQQQHQQQEQEPPPKISSRFHHLCCGTHRDHKGQWLDAAHQLQRLARRGHRHWLPSDFERKQKVRLAGGFLGDSKTTHGCWWFWGDLICWNMLNMLKPFAGGFGDIDVSQLRFGRMVRDQCIWIWPTWIASFIGASVSSTWLMVLFGSWGLICLITSTVITVICKFESP